MEFDDFMNMSKYIMVAVFILAVIVVSLCVIFEYSPICAAKGAAMNKQVKWNIFTDCMIKAENMTWIPLDNYRYFESK